MYAPKTKSFSVLVKIIFVICQQSFTVLGVALSKVELNETNFSEVLRLFILARNAGDPHPVRNTVDNFEYDVPVSPYTLVPTSSEILGHF